MRKYLLATTVYLLHTGACLSQGLAPIGLMTDLLMDTETVCQGGYATSATLSQVVQAWERASKLGLNNIPYQVSAIHSQHPRLGWELPTGGFQTAYRILVATSADKLQEGEADIWDSEKQTGDRCTGIPMEGKELQARHIYFWAVKVWDKQGEESPYSTPRAFITASQMDGEFPRYPLTKNWELPVRMVGQMADFGRAAYGQILLDVIATEADTLIIRLGEAQADGHVNRKPGASIRYSEYQLPVHPGSDTYRLTLPPDSRNAMIKPQGQDVRPVLMPDYIGEVTPFRYCEVEARHGSQTKQITREAVTYRWTPDAASFRSSDETLNQVWELCRYSTQMTSFCGVYVDGDRERIPYEADALINQLSHYCTDQDYSMARYTVDYLCHNATWPTEWILQALILAWNDYMYTGDDVLLQRDYDILKARTLEALTQENGLISTKKGQSRELLKQCGYYGNEIRDIVDWPQSGAFGIGKEEPGEADGYQLKDYNTVVNAYHYEALKLMSQIAAALGRKEDAATYSAKAEVVKTAVNTLLLDTQNGWYLDGLETDHHSLHASMMPLAFGMVPPEYKNQIIHHIESRGMACSVYGAQLLLDALYEAGDAEYALKLMTATGDRSWMNMIRVGSTVTLEAWDAKFKPNLDWNHAWGTAPANIIPRRLMGITPIEPGWSRIRVMPQPGTLEWAEAKVPTIRGAIEARIEQKEGEFRLNVEIPAGCQAEVYLPCPDKKFKLTVNGTTQRAKRQDGQIHLTLEGGHYDLAINR